MQLYGIIKFFDGSKSSLMLGDDIHGSYKVIQKQKLAIREVDKSKDVKYKRTI